MDDFRQYAVFDGNPHISPMMVILVVMGIFFLATIPPLGIILIVVGINTQRRRRKRYKARVQAGRETLAQRQERERHRALMSL